MFFSSECRSSKHSLQDAGQYNSDVDMGTATEKPPQWPATWLQGTTITMLLMSLLTFLLTATLIDLAIP